MSSLGKNVWRPLICTDEKHYINCFSLLLNVLAVFTIERGNLREQWFTAFFHFSMLVPAVCLFHMCSTMLSSYSWLLMSWKRFCCEKNLVYKPTRKAATCRNQLPWLVLLVHSSLTVASMLTTNNAKVRKQVLAIAAICDDMKTIQKRPAFAGFNYQNHCE